MYSDPAIYLFATLLCILLNDESRATVIDSPSNLTKMPGQYANFTCTVPCTHRIDWFVEGHPYSLRGMVDDFEYQKRVISQCTAPDGSGEYAESLDILTTLELDQTALQCAAQAISTVGDCSQQLSYSRFAVLTVEPIEEPLLPSPSPVLCPSIREQGTLTTVSVLASTETVTVTATVTSTVTNTVTSTVVLTVTPPPEPISAVSPLSVGINWKVLASIAIAVTIAALFL